MLPSHPEEINTAMMLFTRQNFEKAQFIEYNNISSVQESHYNATLDTKIIIHGSGSSCNRVWAREMRLSFLAVVSRKTPSSHWVPHLNIPLENYLVSMSCALYNRSAKN